MLEVRTTVRESVAALDALWSSAALTAHRAVIHSRLVRFPILISCRTKKADASLCILRGEMIGTKISEENLFSLPICDIMGLAKKPSFGRKVARGA